MKNIPHLNLNDFLSGDSKTKNEFIEQLGKGFSEIGFIAIKGHLLDDRTKDELYTLKLKASLTCLMKSSQSILLRV